MSDRHVSLLILAILLMYACKIDRPKQAALEYCDCYEQKLKQGIDEMTTQRFCDSLLIMEYRELYMYYIDTDDTSNWQEAMVFHTAYVNYKAKYCVWKIGKGLDSSGNNKDLIY